MLLNIFEKNKKILIIVGLILVSPIILNISIKIANLILDLGTVLGSNIRILIEGKCTIF